MAECMTSCKSISNDDIPNVEQRVHETAHDKYVPNIALQNRLPKLNARVAVSEKMQKRITIATSLPQQCHAKRKSDNITAIRGIQKNGTEGKKPQ